MQGILTGVYYRSLLQDDLTHRIRCIYGRPLRHVYQRYMDLRWAPREEVDVLLYTIGCVRLPATAVQLPLPLVVFFERSAYAAKVIHKVRNTLE